MEPVPNNKWQPFVSIQNCFSVEECRQALKFPVTYDEATVQRVDQGGGYEMVPEPSHRRTKVGWIKSDTAEGMNLFQKIFSITEKCNNLVWKANIYGLEALQLAKYEVEDGYDWHIDMWAEKASLRKLSFTVQLSVPESYEGGELEFELGSQRCVADKSRGAVTIFPSYMLHRVKPITKGVRHSLVGWIVGEPYK